MNSAFSTQPGSTPLEAYHRLLEAGEIRRDKAQESAVMELDRLWQALQQPTSKGLLHRWVKRPQAAPEGVYLWGGVGRGKTWLMDLFLETLPSQRRIRAHFHRFMSRVHDSLKANAGERDPLKAVARQWATKCDILCFDEFFVSDIADAMLLGGLLEALLNEGIVLVATSNLPPDELYRDGLQRARFLPAIAVIKRHCRVVHLAGSTDHRLRILERSGVFQTGPNPACNAAMHALYEHFSGSEDLGPCFAINGREFRARRRGLGIVWLDFEELCVKPRSAADYIELARDFNTVLVSDVPQMTDQSADAARRFIALVDELYDRKVKLILSAATATDRLYTGERLAFEYQRTASRLTEMQGHDYLAASHLP